MYIVCIKEGDYGFNHHFNIDNQSGDIIMEQYGKFQANEISRYEFIKIVGYRFSARTDV
jgi:hypothetical protein